MRLWQGLTKANWLRFQDSMMETHGRVSRPRAAPSRSGSAIPCRRPDTGFGCGGRHDRAHLFEGEHLIRAISDSKRGAVLKKLPPTRTLGRSEDIAGVVSFLDGPDGGWVNSQVVRANGGFK